jgi:DNA polymerase-3 subunit gamma/tau
MGLITDYRPDTLDKFYGNPATVESLQVVLSKDIKKIPHAFLFTGPSGCGKTTLGRIVARELGCGEQDYREFDTADFRGIDTIRQLRSNMRLKPISGPVRVYLLDECHQLTKDAQNALLKGLEEAPNHVYFILATTDPQGLLETIRTRCTTYSVSFLEEDDLVELVKKVARKERYRPAPELLDVIVRDSLGSPRAALSMLEKVIGVDPEKAVELAQQVAEEQNTVIELCRALLKKAPWKVVSGLLKNLKDDPESSRRAILTYFSKVLLDARGSDANESRAYLIMDAFSDSFYYVGKAGLIKAAYEALYFTDNG